MSRTTAYPGERARAEGHRALLDRSLGLFADVRGGEAVTALLLMLNLFFLLASYYLLKTIREPLILAQGAHSAELKSYASAAIAGLLILVVPLYSAIASRVSRVKLINGVTLFFIACLVAFFLADRIGYGVGTAFFIWVGIFNVLIIAQLWAFANDVYTVDQGKRLFAIVGFGASLGAIVGSFVTGNLVKQFGPYPFMLAAAALLGISMVLTNLINVREKSGGEGQPETPGDKAAAAKAPAADDPRGQHKRSGFALVFASRYLLLIALLMVLANLVNTTGEYILSATVKKVLAAQHGGIIDEEKAIGGFYGNYFTIVNIVSAVIQMFVVSRILKWFGVRTALLVLPVVALAGYASMAFVPVLAFIRSAKIAENSIDYSLQNTTRNALYLPTSRAEKYKAKQANDTFFVRLGDVLSAGLVFAGTHWLMLEPSGFAKVALALIVVWLVIAFALGRMFQQKAGTA